MLDGVGIPVVMSLAKVHTELIQAAGITLEHRLVSDPAQAVEVVISQWEFQERVVFLQPGRHCSVY